MGKLIAAAGCMDNGPDFKTLKQVLTLVILTRKPSMSTQFRVSLR